VILAMKHTGIKYKPKHPLSYTWRGSFIWVGPSITSSLSDLEDLMRKSKIQEIEKNRKVMLAYKRMYSKTAICHSIIGSSSLIVLLSLLLIGVLESLALLPLVLLSIFRIIESYSDYTDKKDKYEQSLKSFVIEDI